MAHETHRIFSLNYMLPILELHPYVLAYNRAVGDKQRLTELFPVAPLMLLPIDSMTSFWIHVRSTRRQNMRMESKCTAMDN